MPKISFRVPKLDWPKAGDRPFQLSTDPRSEARLDMAYLDLGFYATAYSQAAERLINCALRPHAEYPDLAVLPVFFLYRHYLELILKHIICLGRGCSLEEAGVSSTHDLSRLWSEARSVLELLWPGQSQIEMAAVGRCVSEFHRCDESSEESRYPITGKRHKQRKAFRSLTRVDLRNLKRVMAGVANFLDGCADGIDYLNSNSQ
jgi:hypothetical protein